jgi:hypothetical protein
MASAPFIGVASGLVHAHRASMNDVKRPQRPCSISRHVLVRTRGLLSGCEPSSRARASPPGDRGLRPPDSLWCYRLELASTGRTAVRMLLRCLQRRAGAASRQSSRGDITATNRGIDIDYEHLALTTDPRLATKVRRAFTLFVTKLCPRMHALSKLCVVTVMPRTSDRLTVWRGKLIPGVYNYRAIAAAASRMRVMAYDQHASTTAPGPIAGFPWVRAITSTSPGRRRLTRWSSGSRPTAVTGPRERLPRSPGSRRCDWRVSTASDPCSTRYSKSSRSPTALTGFGTECGSATPRRVAARYDLARDIGMAGAAYWAAGLEQRGTWGAVRRR